MEKEYMRIFTIGDTHFEHIEMYEKFKIRPRDFQEKIIKHWNNNVVNSDLIIHVGDVSFAKSEEWGKLITSLPGRKILCRGNHDAKSVRWYMRHGFDFCCDEFLVDIYGARILFSHEPKYTNNFDLNIHGHIHVNNHRDYVQDDKHWLISLELGGYHPRLLSTIITKWRNNLNKKDTIKNG